MTCEWQAQGVIDSDTGSHLRTCKTEVQHGGQTCNPDFEEAEAGGLPQVRQAYVI